MARKLDQSGVSLQLLLRGIAAVPGDVSVTDIALDSRQAAAGGAFLACRGIKTHGLQHVQPALAAGVRAVVWEPAPGIDAPQLPSGVLSVAVPGLSRHVGEIADRFFGHPSQQVRVAAITGTNGKTTSAWLLAQALESLGLRSAYAGTLGWGKAGAKLDTTSSHTTPDAVSVHRKISGLHAAGVRTLAMEISSHALAQDRVAGMHFDTALFTNLSRDHLDYHLSMEAYGAAKARLFAWPGVEHRVINMGDAYGRQIAAALPAGATMTAVWVGEGDYSGAGVGWAESSKPNISTRQKSAMTTSGGFVQVREVVAASGGLDLAIESSWGAARLRSRLIGDFNAENLAGVLAVLLLWEVPLQKAIAALETAVAPPGRMETFPAAGRALAVVDYAHTPDALAKALRALRRHTTDKLWCVFGCGGDRDAGKRPIMGALAAELADEIILTDDNPRTEDAAAIVAQIAAGIPAGTPMRIERDRRRAIELALASAQPRDAVLIAGKGHEDYQIYGTQPQPFSDRAEVLRVLGGAA